MYYIIIYSLNTPYYILLFAYTGTLQVRTASIDLDPC